MHVGARRLCKSLKKVLGQLGLEIANSPRRDSCRAYTVRPASQVHCGDRERFVHGHEEISRAQDSTLGSQRFHDSLAESDPHILDGVVLVHVQVAVCFKGQVEASVPGNQIQHVV